MLKVKQVFWGFLGRSTSKNDLLSRSKAKKHHLYLDDVL